MPLFRFEFKTTVMFSSGSKHNWGKHVSNPLAGLGMTCSYKMDQCSCGGATDLLILLLRNNIED